MTAKRTASRQVGFRIEPTLSDRWAQFISESLVSRREHLACAMLMYLGASSAQREAVQRAYARFQRTGRLETPSPAPATAQPLSADELELLAAYRNANDEARDEAIADLLDRPVSSSHMSDTAERSDHRAG